ELPNQIPVSPPEMNKLTKPIANNMAGVNLMFPRQRVVSQLNTLIAEGTAISNVSNTKTEPRNGFKPVTNIWCAQTRKERMAIANKEPTIAIYPKMGFLAFTLITSETNPIAGKMMMYTSGCPRNQNRCW